MAFTFTRLAGQTDNVWPSSRAAASRGLLNFLHVAKLMNSYTCGKRACAVPRRCAPRNS